MSYSSHFVLEHYFFSRNPAKASVWPDHQEIEVTILRQVIIVPTRNIYCWIKVSNWSVFFKLSIKYFWKRNAKHNSLKSKSINNGFLQFINKYFPVHTIFCLSVFKVCAQGCFCTKSSSTSLQQLQTSVSQGVNLFTWAKPNLLFLLNFLECYFRA